MRVGQNPAKFVYNVAQPERVTVAVVSYVPFLDGYYAQGLDVLKVCLNSIWENTRTSYDLMVFDNASCPEVRDYLSEVSAQGKIQYLVLSEKNIGKAGAWNFIFGAAPGDYIAYADSDVYFYPGWLAPQIEVLENFPRVGMVTGMPLWTPEEYSTATIQWAEESPEVLLERGRLLAWEEYWQHARSLGADEAKARTHFETNDAVCIFYKGQKYHVGAAHFQFVALKSVLQSVMPIPSRRPMGEVRLLDVALNERGYLRLSTSQRWVEHLGNTLKSVSKIRLSTTHHKGIRRRSWSLVSLRPIEKMLRWLYHLSFDLLYRK
jgi:glycosyltransferase involved in cell wall biosynthesis